MIKTLKLGGVSGRMPLILGLGLGLLAAALAFVYLSNQSSDSGSVGGVAAEPVVVAAQDIPAGSTITAEMITLKDLAISSIIPDVYRETDAVVGQVTTVQIVAGEQVLATKVSTTAIDISTIVGELPLSLVIPPGHRGFAIALSESGAAGGLVQPGDYVDVMITAEAVNAETNQLGISACYLMQDVRVVALAQNVINTPASADQSNIMPASGAENPGAATATLAVTPEQAAVLAAGQRSLNGANVEQHLWVSLRPFGDHGINSALPSCTQ